MEFLFSLENVWKDPASESLHCLGRTATSFSLISLSCDTTSLLPSQGHSLVSAAQDRRAIHTCETMCNTQLHFNITCTSPGFATMLVQASLRSSSRKKSWVESQSRVLLDERIHLQVLRCVHCLHHFLLLYLHLLLPHQSGKHQGQPLHPLLVFGQPSPLHGIPPPPALYLSLCSRSATTSFVHPLFSISITWYAQGISFAYYFTSLPDISWAHWSPIMS